MPKWRETWSVRVAVGSCPMSPIRGCCNGETAPEPQNSPDTGVPGNTGSASHDEKRPELPPQGCERMYRWHRPGRTTFPSPLYDMVIPLLSIENVRHHLLLSQ